MASHGVGSVCGSKAEDDNLQAIHMIHVDPSLHTASRNIPGAMEHMGWEVVIHVDQMDQVDHVDQGLVRQ